MNSNRIRMWLDLKNNCWEIDDTEDVNDGKVSKKPGTTNQTQELTEVSYQ